MNAIVRNKLLDFFSKYYWNGLYLVNSCERLHLTNEFFSAQLNHQAISEVLHEFVKNNLDLNFLSVEIFFGSPVPNGLKSFYLKHITAFQTLID